MTCSVFGCVNSDLQNADTSVCYYQFPKHPSALEQWIQVCGWPPEQIDLNTARICSIHFEENCYRTEFKMMDYMTCCTKVLKYDAVPTLYLPTTQIMIKHEDLREMILFTVPTGDGQPEAVSKEFLSLQVQQPSIVEETQEQTSQLLYFTDISPYKHITSKKELLDVEKTNKELQEKVEKLRAEIEETKEKLAKSVQNIRENDLELSKIKEEYENIKRPILPAQQRKLLAKVFSESQIKILSGKKKIYWTNDDMAVAYTIRHLSNKRCYLYLTKKINIPLPAVSSIKRWMTMKSSTKKSRK